jgi:hypothetical protein
MEMKMNMKTKYTKRSSAKMPVDQPIGSPPGYSKFSDADIVSMLVNHLSKAEQQRFDVTTDAEMRDALDRLHLGVNVGIAVLSADLTGFMARTRNIDTEPFTAEGHVAMMAAAFAEGKRILDDPTFMEFVSRQPPNGNLLHGVIAFVRGRVVTN